MIWNKKDYTKFRQVVCSDAPSLACINCDKTDEDIKECYNELLEDIN